MVMQLSLSTYCLQTDLSTSLGSEKLIGFMCKRDVKKGQQVWMCGRIYPNSDFKRQISLFLQEFSNKMSVVTCAIELSG